jgi:hypothetical protein
MLSTAFVNNIQDIVDKQVLVPRETRRWGAELRRFENKVTGHHYHLILETWAGERGPCDRKRGR